MSDFVKRIYKVCIVGDGGVGKSAILKQYIEGVFLENIKMTIGTNFYIKDLTIPELNLDATLQIWDLAGQEQFNVVRPYFYNGSQGIIYTFDLTRKMTFFNLSSWKTEVEKAIEPKPSVLIGNKLDLFDKGLEFINDEEDRAFIEKLNIRGYFETSARNNIGIENAFIKLTTEIFNTLGSKK